ncbi:hypothetical protein ACMYSO_21860 [Klebsiella sp. B345]|uniref:hypothetical protein n=1 Tax=Klebsiella sp. B345 TaxID=2755398 RepID=UPI003DA7C5DA
MKLGFLAGAVLATWLSLTYPTEMRAVFDKLTTVFDQIVKPVAAHSSEMATPE